MKNNSKKKGMKILVGFITLALIGSTFATIASMRNAKSKKNVQQVNEETVKTEGTKEVDKDINEVLKKDMASAKVEAGDKEVKAKITVTSEANKIQLDKIAEEYSKQLQEKYKGKDVKVEVLYGGKTAAESNVYNPVKDEKNKDIPKMTVRMENALSTMDRHVIITLDTKTPEKYTVTVLGQKCRYAVKQKFFHTVVETTNEKAIKDSIKITVNK
ncbi:hypothetical protein [Clostridium sp. ZS2-4]|uniref:hypothetical protein n=1 Tax=Clostridium sp. ZS2-4 TaxID=2987703 RepID=UPI00227C7030|nr:hypothetical protein [Clostridium sp. ZS2-4]MCY6355100.1 hypothetical protein [Clostridium sp. ZS2-4]